MSKRSGRNHSPAFKTKVALQVMKGGQTVIQPAERFGVHPMQVAQWRSQLLERAAEVSHSLVVAAQRKHQRRPRRLHPDAENVDARITNLEP